MRTVDIVRLEELEEGDRFQLEPHGMKVKCFLKPFRELK